MHLEDGFTSHTNGRFNKVMIVVNKIYAPTTKGMSCPAAEIDPEGMSRLLAWIVFSMNQMAIDGGSINTDRRKNRPALVSDIDDLVDAANETASSSSSSSSELTIHLSDIRLMNISQ